MFFEEQKGYVRKRAIEKSWVIPFCCLCSQVCIHKSILISHFNTKQANIKSRAPFFEIFETLQVKSPRSKTASGTHKTETFPIPRVLYIRMSRKEAIEDTFDDLHADNKDNIYEEESEVTVMDIDNFRNECMR